MRGGRRGSRGRGAMLAAVLLLAVLGGASTARAGVYWSAPIQIAPSRLVALSCPTTTLCVGVDFGGNVLASGNPTLGQSAWSTTPLAPSLGLDDVSCAPGGTVCAAVGEAGIFVSTDPTGGSWQRVTGSTGAGHVSCPASGLCVATSAREVISSTTPAAPGTPWQAVEPTAGAISLGAVSCPTTGLCVALNGGAEGGIYTSTDPTGGAGAWVPGQLGNVPVDRISCPTAGFCAAIGEQALATTSNPAAGAAGWQASYPVAGLKQMQNVACASASLCAAVGENGYASSSSTPASAPSWEAVEGIDGNNWVDAISCPSETMCFAADEALEIGLAAHHLNVATAGAGEGEVRSGPLGCPFGCTYSGPVCPRNCGANQFPDAFIPQRLSEIVCGDSEIGGGTKWTFSFCSMLYPEQDAPELTPKPRPGSVFAGWGGACSGRGTCAPPMTTDRSVTAVFEPKFALQGVRQLHARWRERGGNAHAPVGTSFTFTLNREATVTLSFTRLAPGERSRHGCRPIPKHHAHIRRCTRHLPEGTLHIVEQAGTDTIPFPGIVSVYHGGHVDLRPGSYTLKLGASSGGETAPATQLSFTILK